MDIAITGSSGFVGSALTSHLRSEGHRVVRIKRSAANGPDEVSWNIGAGTMDSDGLEGLDAVVHLAGEGIAEKRWTDTQKAKILDSRVDGTDLLARTLASLERPPSRLLSGSAIGFYGARGDERLDEASARGAGFLSDVCVAWEAATGPASEAGIAVTHLRTGIVLDPSGGALSKQLPLFKLGLGGRIGTGRQYLSWITLADIVRGITHLAASDLTGPVNLTAPEPVTNSTFTESLGAAVNRPTLIPIPNFGPRLLLGRELAESLLHDSTRVIPSALEKDGFSFESSDIDAAFAAVL